MFLHDNHQLKVVLATCANLLYSVPAVPEPFVVTVDVMLSNLLSRADSAPSLHCRQINHCDILHIGISAALQALHYIYIASVQALSSSYCCTAPSVL